MTSQEATEIRKSLIALIEAQNAQLDLLEKIMNLIDPPREEIGRKMQDGSWTYTSVGRRRFYWNGDCDD